MQVCNYASMQVCTYMQVCKYASMHIYASMQVCKYAHIPKSAFVIARQKQFTYVLGDIFLIIFRHVSIQQFCWSEHACMHGIHKCACIYRHVTM